MLSDFRAAHFSQRDRVTKVWPWAARCYRIRERADSRLARRGMGIHAAEKRTGCELFDKAPSHGWPNEKADDGHRAAMGLGLDVKEVKCLAGLSQKKRGAATAK
jgi:hypothetical protein